VNTHVYDINSKVNINMLLLLCLQITKQRFAKIKCDPTRRKNIFSFRKIKKSI